MQAPAQTPPPQPPDAYYSPSDASAGGPGNYVSPGDPYAVGLFKQPSAPGEQGSLPPGMGPPGMAAGANARSMSSSTRWLVLASVAVLVIVVVLAGIYFLALRKTEATAPEQTVLKYFEAISAGDANTIKTLFTPEAMPDQATLDVVSKYLGAGALKYEDIKLKTLSQTATDAQVQLLDFTVTVNSGGQHVSQKMSSLGTTAKMVIGLKNVNGAWLINQRGQMPSNFTVPGSGSTAPSGSN